MNFKKVNSITNRISLAIAEIKTEAGLEHPFVSNFCRSLQKDIAAASTPDPCLKHIDREFRYIEAIKTVMSCYSTILQSNCLQTIEPATLIKLMKLTQTNYD